MVAAALTVAVVATITATSACQGRALPGEPVAPGANTSDGGGPTAPVDGSSGGGSSGSDGGGPSAWIGGEGATPELLFNLGDLVFWDLRVTDRHFFLQGHNGGPSCAGDAPSASGPVECVLAIPRPGGTLQGAIVLGAQTDGLPGAFVRGQAGLYFSEGLTGAGDTGQLALATDDEPPRVMTQDLGHFNPYFVAESDGRLYLSSGQDIHALDAFGGPNTLLRSTGELQGLFADPRGVYFIEGGQWKWIDRSDASGSPTVLAPLGDAPSGAVADDDSLYWLADTTLKRLRKATGEVTDLATGLDPGPSRPVAMGGSIYVGVIALGQPAPSQRILQIPREGGPAVVLASDDFIDVLDVDATHVYWGTGGQLVDPEDYPQATLKRAPHH
jgi:hypothetical protein